MRAFEKIYDVTSASGVALDTGVLDTGKYDMLLGVYSMSGGSPTACQAYISKTGAATYTAFGAAATPTVAGQLFCWGPIITGGTGTITAPVPQWVRFTVGAITSQTVTFTLWGIRN